MPCLPVKVLLSEGTFHLSNPIEPNTGIEIKILGKLRVDDAISSLLTADAASGQPFVTVANASQFFIGQWVIVTDTSHGALYGRKPGGIGPKCP